MMRLHTAPQYTGEACLECRAPQEFIPGYLTSRQDGSRVYTVARLITHAPDCPISLEVAA